MTGAKGRSGGARHGAGRLQTRIQVSRAHAEKLAIIVGSKRALNPAVTAEQLIEQWIDAVWTELDALYQENAEKAHE